MPKITINQWGGGIASHYHTGQENQCADIKNISVTAHPDAIMLANAAEKMLEAGGKISCGFHLKEFIKKENIWTIVATENGEIWYNNQKIHTETGRVYRQVFYDVYTENKVKKSGIFLIHNTGVDRYEYDKNTNTFINFTKNIDKFSLDKPSDDVKNFPILRVNNQVFIGWGNKIIVWDGVIFQKELNFSEITKIVGLSAYGDYVHIYATDGESSYKWIYDPVNDKKQPWSMKNFPRLSMQAVTTDGNTDLIVTDSDDIYQSSGLQIQKYLNYEKNIFVPDRNFGNIAINHEDTNYISAENALYILKSWEIGTPPILQKIAIDGKISFAYATKDEIYIATTGQKHILQKISVTAGENVAESGEYETLFYRSQEYGKLSKIRIRANCHGKSGGIIEIFARRDIADDWTKLCEFTDKKWIQKREKTFLNDKLWNFSEIQFKIVLTKSQDGKSPLLYEFQAEYDDTNTATI